jgi:hypothetical protein
MSKTNVETLLHDRIETVSAELEKAKPGTPEHNALKSEFDELMGRSIEMDRLDRESEEHAITREEEKKDRLIKNIISAAGIVLPLVVTIWGTKVSLEFEKEGTFTTIMGRGFINKLLPKK